MKKFLKIGLPIIIVVLIIVFALVGTYNGLVESSANVDLAQANISTQLQRRADLIPNFVNTVKGYSDYEKETFTAVTEARTAVQKANGVTEQAEASQQLDRAVDIWVNAVTEAYPELKANTQYQALLDELAGTENRIAVARKDYNEAAKSHNTSIRKFPKSIIAKLFGFSSFNYFEADDNAQNVPEVSFN